MTNDLHTRAVAAVAAVPADYIGSRRVHAVRAIRASYITDGMRAPSISDLADAVDEVMEQPTPAVVSGDGYYTYGTDLDYVLNEIIGINPIDPETEDITDTMWAASNALGQVRAAILRRKACQAGPRQVDYCGVDGVYGRACGPDLGLPSCAYHARPALAE